MADQNKQHGGQYIPSYRRSLDDVQHFLASLTLTVILFALSIILVLAGTLAQVEMDIWEVIAKYFRTPVAWIDLQICFPPTLFPSKPQVPDWLVIPFPGGWTIGLFLMVNLFHAHWIRFKVQANGARKTLGWLVFILGGFVTWYIIASNPESASLQSASQAYLDSAKAQETGKQDVAPIGAGSESENKRNNEGYMRILWQLVKATTAGAVLLAGCLMLFKRRGGIVVMHLGVGLMMINELLVGLIAIESQMSIQEGETVDWVQDIREVELAIVDRSGETKDDVVAIPQRLVIESGVSPQRMALLHLLWQGPLIGLLTWAGSLFLRDKSTALKRMFLILAIWFLPNFAFALTHKYLKSQPAAAAAKSMEVQLPNDGPNVSIEVVEYLKNADLVEIKAKDKEQDNLATRGIGLKWRAQELRPGTGTDTGGAVDAPAAYMRFTSKDTGEELGTWLLSPVLGHVPEEITIGDKTYQTQLRFRRYHKPYTMNLIRVRKKDYMGTSTPRDYSSALRLVDPAKSVDQNVMIWMNNPLRYGGETFYQSGYHENPRTGAKTTTLSVVSNFSWMIPYVSCMIVGVGMLYHFGLTLVRFVKHAVQQVKPATGTPIEAVLVDTPPEPRPKKKKRKKKQKKIDLDEIQLQKSRFGIGWILSMVVFPLFIVALFGFQYAKLAQPPKVDESNMDLYAFGQLPVVHQGRPKPIDTFARNSLRSLSNRATFLDDDDERQPAIRWLLDVICKPEEAAKYKVFRIESLDLLAELKLERRMGYRYSLDEIYEEIRTITEKAEAARKLDVGDLSIHQKKVLELERKIGVLDLVMQSFSLPRLSPATIREDMMEAISRQRALKQRQPPLSIPPSGDESEDWETFPQAWMIGLITANMGQDENPATKSIGEILRAYAEDDAKEFNKAVQDYHAYLAEADIAGLDVSKVSFESFFNNFSPFLYSAWFYVAAFMLTALSWLFAVTRARQPFNVAAFALIGLIFLMHSAAIVGRIYISGRAPVTNLYSSAIFIGWAGVLFGIVIETISRIGVGNALASAIGFGTLLIAYYLSGDGDTFTVLQAVLDTQFWLSTHVLCITLGYAATFVAGGLGAAYILGGMISPSVRRIIYRMTYGVLCFAIFFSFIGTVLGGLWADDSWGRFWGWDPKENGALIIVLWNALVLHARWGGLVKERGLAVLSVGGNIVTGWSWFGVNELGVGLHSYGFTEGVWFALVCFFLSQFAIMGIGLIPTDVKQLGSTGS